MDFEFIGIEKIKDVGTLVVVGKHYLIEELCEQLGFETQNDIFCLPYKYAHYSEYKNDIVDFKNYTNGGNIPIIATQSKEFLDLLLESDIPFTLVGLKKYDERNDNKVYLRIDTKEDALRMRQKLDMELRC